jgi:tRNA(His) 5'-end guanylyltransferase
MVETAIRLCSEIQGAQLAYVQSDEISVLVHGYKKVTSEPWFGNQIQKMSSVAASIAAATFTSLSYKIWHDFEPSEDVFAEREGDTRVKPAYFDARTFVVPENDVNNYFIWRQQDATRNSVQMLAQHVLGHKTCMNKDVRELKDVLAAKQTPWENLSVATQRGTCITRKLVDKRLPTGELVQRSVWSPDTPTPEFRNDSTYVERLLATED